MGVLWRKIIRDLWQSKSQFISVLVIIIIGVMFYSGINATYRDLSLTSQKYYNDYRFGDLWADMYRAPDNIEAKLEELPFVKKATGRLIEDVKMEFEGENVALRVITLPDKKTELVNDIVIKSGGYFTDSGSNQCLVEEEFLKANSLTVGDYLNPVINGSEVRLRITGAVKSPEFIYPIKDGSQLIADSKRFGIIFVKKSFGQSVFDMEGSINNVSMLLQDGTDIDKASNEIRKHLKEFGIKGLIEREDQISNRMLSQEMDGLEKTAGVFPIIFFIVAAVIIYINMGRMVENQRSQIGVLKALGFSNFKVLMHYLSYSAFLGLLGSLIGAVFGLFLGKGFTNLENQYFHLPEPEMQVYPDLILPASALTLFFCLLAGYNSCKRVFRIMPSDAMRPKAPMKGRKILLERIGAFWNSLKYSWKIIFRNIFRYKRRALLTSVGVIFATAITVISFGMQSSVDYLVVQQFSTIQNYDIKAGFNRFLNMEELTVIKNLPHVRKLEPVVETGIRLSNGWRNKEIAYTALIDDPEIYRVTDKNGNPIKLPESGILIPEKLATGLELKKGDTATVEPFLPDKPEKSVKIKGLIVQYLGTSAYGSLDTVKYLFGEGLVANSVVIRLSDTAYEKEVIKKLKEMPVVSSVESKSEALENLNKNLGSMTATIGVMILLAAILSIAVIYNIASINIFERQRELATLKVLGFKDKEIAGLIFNENYLITLFGAAAGLLFGSWGGVNMMKAFETDMYTFPYVAGSEAYIYAFALTMGFTFIANMILRKRIRKIDMVEVLKSNE